MGDPIYVTDKDTLRHVVENNNRREKTCIFLYFYLSYHAERLFIGKNVLAEIEREVQGQQHLSQGLREHILTSLIPQIYGIAQVYIDPKDDDGDITKIVERNYATVKYLITVAPEKYRGGKIKKFDDASIVTPFGFMQFVMNDPRHAEFVKLFEGLWSELERNQ